MWILDLDVVRGDALAKIKSLTNFHSYLLFETYFMGLATREYIVNILAEMGGWDDRSRAIRALLLAYLTANSRKQEWMPLRTGQYGGVDIKLIDAEIKNTLDHFVRKSPTCFSFSQADVLLKNNPIYGMRGGKSKVVPAGGGDLTSGVCLSLCYDWVRRLIAGAPVNNIVADAVSQGVFSMQRAYKEALSNKYVTNRDWVKMLAKGDGLTCTDAEWTNANFVMSIDMRAMGAWDEVAKHLKAGPAIICLMSESGAIAHAIGVQNANNAWYLFDPNFGHFPFWSTQSLCTGFVLLLQYNAEYFKMADHGLIFTFGGTIRQSLKNNLLGIQAVSS